MKTEIQTCPDRISQFGPWKRDELLDTWDRGRWSNNLLLVRVGRFLRKWANILKNHGKQTFFEGDHNDEWLWRGPIPRTCSFCGGIHPDDAIRLVSEGWEMENTGKSYKRYLEPPGYHNHMEELHQKIYETGVPVDHSTFPEFWSPVPPVKLYVTHFDKDQVEKFNEALSASST
jgi:hypothetical protein